MEKISEPFQDPKEQSQKNDAEEELLSNLPKAKDWNGGELHHYQGLWYPSTFIRGVVSFQKHFQANADDIILASFPKCGTTWLKALMFTIVNRSRYPLESSPLLTANPHEVVRFLDLDIYSNSQSPNLEHLPRPRMFAVHTSFSSLPHSVADSDCRMVYICRNPLDQFISYWIFSLHYKKPDCEPVSFDEAFDMFCDGVGPFGPFWKHVLEYWKVSQEQPHKMLFLKYEDLQENIVFEVKKLARFLGCPFSKDEENQGMAEKISSFCSFDNLRNLEVNKTGKQPALAPENKFLLVPENKIFFRKGKVGDWKNHLTMSMSERFEKIIKEKFHGSGLTFKTL